MSRTVGKAVEDAVAERLKTPIIATFIFSWILVNHSFVLEFMFETLENKVLLAKGLSFGWLSDLVLPAIFSLVYVLAIPALQLGLDLLVVKLLGKKRGEYERQQQRDSIVNSKAFQEKLAEKDLWEWVGQKKDLESRLSKTEELNQQIIERNKEFKTQVEGLQFIDEVKRNLIEEAITSLERPKLHYGSDYEDTRTREEVCEDVIEILERVTPTSKPKPNKLFEQE
ncbi:conserved hypothetical protein [Vibrio crassostreae]|uniref:hypothetical protein n=1 Tax=Vibrio crassostreae TaxID=246167 RepID=UPI0005DF7B5D|nr:hypothetical protein [Vibrio crassostreae]TCT67642.1 hypothetical protein EDB44_101690 [Vibrio crassostreae]TCT86927.1 hypothetical protein EDB43_10152 [Vibrio crassostreae]TCU07886.1 hypothetical protein EDB47_10252 [Vibrio crassostreae]TDW13292.1 hypothetical protein EDB45_10151 [Vibrio crassostreae]CAK1702917.1 conserved hypothetical protein [Vibrio crassostreae]